MSTSSRWRVRVAADFSVPTVVMTVVGLMTVVGTPQAGPFGNRGNPEETTFMSCSDSRVDWTQLFLGGSAVHHLYFHPMSIPVTWPGVHGLIRGWVGGWVGGCTVHAWFVDRVWWTCQRSGGEDGRPFPLNLLACHCHANYYVPPAAQETNPDGIRMRAILYLQYPDLTLSPYHVTSTAMSSFLSEHYTTCQGGRFPGVIEKEYLRDDVLMPRSEITRSYREGISKRWCFDAKVGDYPELQRRNI